MKDIACALIGISTIIGIVYLTTLPKPNGDAAFGVGFVGIVTVAIIKNN